MAYPIPTSPAPSSSLSLCTTLHQNSVPSLFPQDEAFPRRARSYNRAFNYQPAAICLPETDEQVAHAVLAAHTHGLKVQAKGGGHSYGAYSSGGKDGSLVLHMDKFSEVRLLDDGVTAVVGAGVRLGRLAEELFGLGERALPHGTIKNVGVAGHFSHGGYGYQSRAWGLAVDTICGLDVVLADGSRRHVTAESDPELFFALRGAADSFGIITRFYLKSVPAPSKVVLFSFDIADIVSSVDEATEAFLHLQEVVQDASVVDRKLSFGIYIHDDAWTIWGVYLGRQGHFEDDIMPQLLSGFKRPVRKMVQSMTWLESLSWFSNSHSNDATDEAFDTFYAQSVVVPESAPLAPCVVQKYFHAMHTARPEPSQAWYAVINLHGGPDSQITHPHASPCAYTHRQSLWVVQHYGYSKNHLPPLLDSTKTVIGKLTQVLRDGADSALGAEPNYHDPDMPRDVAHARHFGNAATRRLEALKAVLDPRDVFWNPQSIRPAAR